MSSGAVILALLGLLSLTAGQVLVDTEYGPVQGQTIADVWNGEFSADVNSFLGVPYGADTGGANRFTKPLKPASWAPDVFIADSLGTSCAQGKGGLMSATHPGWDNYGEDCLNINIFTPTVGGPHPVMVWFHGGAYNGGANIQYPGHFLATRNIVVVVVNYRLNYFGFAFTNSEACPGNFGLWDQNLSLQFVRDNIANFGGDPNKVTIFGQSAGASSTGLQIVSPQTQGLINQAILESGTEGNFWSLNVPESTPENYIWEVAGKLNCSEDRTDVEMIECLRGIYWEDLRRARFECTDGYYCLGMAPVVDGPGGFMPEKPEDLLEAGNFMKGPIITGITEADGSYYTAGIIPESLFGGFNRTEFTRYLEERLMAIWSAQVDNVTEENALEAIDWNYAPWPHIDDEYQNRDVFNKLITDGAFGVPWDAQLKRHSQYAPTYGYLYNYRGRNATQVFPEWMGVPHMGEIPQTWGWPLLQFNPLVRNDSGILQDLIDWTDEDVRHTIYWNKLYSNFAHTGDPTSTPVEDPLGGVTNWRPFSYDDMAYLYVYNETVEVQTQYRQKIYAFWGPYANYIMNGATGDSLSVKQNVKSDSRRQQIPSDWLEEFEKQYFDIIVAENLLEDLL